MAQFQMMYKGFIQLAIRSGQYEKMNCSEVYDDELIMYNPITGDCKFVDDFNLCTQRENGEYDKIVGYYAMFKLKSGFTKELYMTKSQIENHAKKYSQAYRYDLKANKKSSKWSDDFDAMAKKTVIKLLLSKWGILSTEMQGAIVDDQKGYDDSGDGVYVDNDGAFTPDDTPIDVSAQITDSKANNSNQGNDNTDKTATKQDNKQEANDSNNNPDANYELEMAEFEGLYAQGNFIPADGIFQ